MPSIDDLKKIPSTGDEIVLGMGAPEETLQTVQQSNLPKDNSHIAMPNYTDGSSRGVRVNIGQKKPKTVIVANPQGGTTVSTSAPAPQEEIRGMEGREEVDFNDLPLNDREKSDQEHIKRSPIDDIDIEVDEYLDNKEKEIQEIYEEVEQNRLEAEAEAEINGETIDEGDEDALDSNEDKVEDSGEDSLLDSILDEDDDFEEEVNNNRTIKTVINDNTEDDTVEEDEKEIEDTKEDSVAATINTTTTTSASSEDDTIIEEDDPDTAALEESTELSREEYLKKLKALATEKLKPAAKALDLRSFTIVRKATSNVSFLKDNPISVAKWVLPNQGSIVLVKEYLGVELEQLRRFSEDTNSATSLTRKFRSIYDHIDSPKPATFEAWLKSTPYSDIDHYFFAIFIASFQGTNYIPYDCTNDKCKETFLSDDMSIMKMVKFKDKAAETKFRKTYAAEEISSTKEGLYVSEIVMISDRIAIAFREPSLYNVIENASLDSAFKTKYSNIINEIPYIDSIYIIEADSKQLIPIDYKIYDNATKTFKSKVQKYNTIFKSFTNDEYTLTQSYVNSLITREQDVTYQYPEIECPKCKTTIEAQPIDAEAMVFTRYQLGALVNTTLN